MTSSSPPQAEGSRELLLADITIFGEEAQQVFECSLTNIDTVRPMPHSTGPPGGGGGGEGCVRVWVCGWVSELVSE